MDGEPFNKTVFGIATPEARYSLAAVTFLVIFISIVGNVLVLVASLRDAIKLDKISVILVKNIAIADLSYAFLVILQVGVSLIAHEWLYGKILCHVTTYLEHVLSATDILLICALNISKLIVILKPFAARQWSNKTAYVIVGLIFLGANVYPVCESVFRKVYFDYRSYRCTFLHEAGVWALTDPLFTVFIVAIPTLVIILSTVGLLVYVNKVSGIHKKAVFTNVWISAIFVISYAPMCTYVLGEKWILHDSKSGNLSTDSVYKNLYRWGMFLKFVNSTANPLIYYATIMSFNTYVKSLFTTKRPKINKVGKFEMGVL